MSSTKRFQAVLLDGHKGTAVEVPFDPASAWKTRPTALRPGRRGFRVSGSLEGIAFESEIVPRSRRFWLIVDDSVRKAARVAIGDSVRVTVAPRAAARGTSPR